MKDKKKNESLENVAAEPKKDDPSKEPRPPVVVYTHGKRFEVPADDFVSLLDFLRQKYPEEYIE